MGPSCEEKKKEPEGPSCVNGLLTLYGSLATLGFLVGSGELDPYGLLSIIGEL
jgi:hypothetical protein